MSLINCSECGNTISDKAAFCPKCGAPVKVAGCIVHFERKRNKFVGTAVNGQVIVDGKNVGSAANGASFDVELSYGSHNVSFDTQITGQLAAGRSNLETLDIPEGAKKVIVSMKIKQDTLGFFANAPTIGIDTIEVIR